MHTQTKGQLTTQVIGAGWQSFLPALPLVDDTHDLNGTSLDGLSLKETRTALEQAEMTLRAQEERIRFLETMILTDELTGLANRRGFAGAFDRDLALARRDSNANGIVVMIDLDGFKGVNDKYGHQAGDAYLRAVAEVLQETVRASDTVARLGGDEFAIILTHISEEDGIKRLSKMERTFNARSIIWNGKRIPMRASFGSAVYNGTCSIEGVLHAADVRLYACKARLKTLSAIAAL